MDGVRHGNSGIGKETDDVLFFLGMDRLLRETHKPRVPTCLFPLHLRSIEGKSLCHWHAYPWAIDIINLSFLAGYLPKPDIRPVVLRII